MKRTIGVAIDRDIIRIEVGEPGDIDEMLASVKAEPEPGQVLGVVEIGGDNVTIPILEAACNMKWTNGQPAILYLLERVLLIGAKNAEAILKVPLDE
ncbi:MAG: hypothetical protein EXS51_04555 [Candidatus Taylorbacteria bacterium]|nr:hypothetical protein [Candidatus Taylorbacteria bacterium]